MLNIRIGGQKDLAKYFTMFEIDFDKRELLPKISIRKSLLNGTAELLIMYDDESKIDLGYAYVIKENVYGYVLLKYFAILPWYRDRGVGKDAMRLVNKYYDKSSGIIVEIPEFENNDIDQIRKLRKFFKRFGYEEISSSYTIGNAKTGIFVKPMKNTSDITPIYHRIMEDFYSRVIADPGTMIKAKAVNNNI